MEDKSKSDVSEMDLPFPQHAHNPYSQDIFSTESLARNYHSSFQNTNNYPRARSSMRLQNHNSLPNVRESPFSPSQQQPSNITHHYLILLFQLAQRLPGQRLVRPPRDGQHILPKRIS